MRLIILFLALTIGGGKAQGATMLVEPAADGSPALVSNCGSIGRCGRATGRRRRGFPAGCPCLTRRRFIIRPRLSRYRNTRQYSTRHGPSQSQTWAMRQADSPVAGNLASTASFRWRGLSPCNTACGMMRARNRPEPSHMSQMHRQSLTAYGQALCETVVACPSPRGSEVL
jgi:hypothetical protein